MREDWPLTLGPSVPGVPGSPRGPWRPWGPAPPLSPGKPRSPCWREQDKALSNRYTILSYIAEYKNISTCEYAMWLFSRAMQLEHTWCKSMWSSAHHGANRWINSLWVQQPQGLQLLRKHPIDGQRGQSTVNRIHTVYQNPSNIV